MNLYLAEFEKQFSEYTGMKFCLATPNCTSAIHLAVLGLGVGSGDEVIVPDITWVASAAPVCYAGARPVFVDIDPQSWCLTAESVERAITPRTKAIVAVGLLGNMPQMNEIRSVASRHRIPIIEDAAESIGAEYNGKKAGTCGKVGVYSFNGTKLMVTGEGGMVVTNDKRLFEKFNRLSHHGMIKNKRSKLYWSTELGYKYRMSNIQAALGIAQLSRIDELVEMRRRIFGWYRERLGGVEGLRLNYEAPNVRNVFWIATAILDKKFRIRKEQLMKELVQFNIAGRPFFYPMSSMPAFKQYCKGRNMARVNPVAYAISPYGICLPSAFSVTEDEVDYVCAVLLKILEKRQARKTS